MNLTFDFDGLDGRRMNCLDVIDQDTGKIVGHIMSEGNGRYSSGGIKISLFDGKYSITVDNREKCWGFVKGVEAVLNHMTEVQERATQVTESAA
jgi:hypothetical protein